MTWFKWLAPLVALMVVSGWVTAGEADVQELLERMRKMENKMADQERTIKDLRSGNVTRMTAAQRVDKALSNSSAGTIFHDPNLHKRPIRIGGYLDVTYTYAFGQPTVPAPQYNMERVFDDMDNNDFNLHLAKIYFDATAQEKGQAGFRIDLAFGSDADRIASFGEWNLKNVQNVLPITHNFVDLDTWVPTVGQDNFTIQQAYIDYIVPVGNGLRMKVGKFDSPIGYEKFEAQDNMNASRSFLYGHAMPKTLTGLGFEYQVYSNWYVAGYFVNGWDNMIDDNEGKSGIIQSKWSPVKWMDWTVSGMVGNEQPDSYLPEVRIPGIITGNLVNGDTLGLNESRAGEDTTYLINTVLEFRPWEKWEFAAEGVWGLTENGSKNDANDGFVDVAPGGLVGGGPFNIFGTYNRNGIVGGFRSTPDAEWWGAAGYMKYKFLPGWYLAARGEYLCDEGATQTVYGRKYWGKQELYSGTLTMSYSPTEPFEMRLEYRYDASSRDVFISKQMEEGFNWNLVTGNNAFDFHQQDYNEKDRVNSQDTLTVQFLYKF